MVSISTSASPPGNEFLPLLPSVQRHAKFAFRGLPTDAREEAIAEAVAAAFVAFLQLRRRQKDPSKFPSMLATFAVLHVRGQRQVAGKSGSRDVLSKKAQRRHGFQIQPLHHGEPSSKDDWQDAVVDNTQSPVPEQASFRLAFPTFLASLSPRDQKIACFLGQGNSATEAAVKFGVSAPRITQLRQQWCKEWRALNDELPAEVAP